ncbi:ATP-binding protein [Pectinatus frisingensis]|uniref:ATP-binding protein n=1 Tax=Pectinatus frisingensis TaxID=865 RepID=UPI0018C492EF|nr:ATP-binding protein [Pectinatus frisingensis]
MIRQPNEIIDTNKKIRILIAGYPGIGKTTLALSAPKPLLIDVDRGTDRVEARYRTPFTQPKEYGELLNDLQPQNLNNFETLVIDTGGQLIKLMANYVIKQNCKNGQSDGSLSLKGYGAVGREFERFINYCYYNLDKHIVIVFHAKEEKDGDNTRLRLLVEGQTKDNVWQPMDLGGYMEMHNNKRTIGFTNCDRYYAKGTHGINGVITIPDLKGQDNTFLTDLFKKVNDNICAEALEAEQQKKQYEDVMSVTLDTVNSIETVDDANTALDVINNQKHILTSLRESKAALFDKTKELNFKWDRKSGGFISAVPNDAIAS